MKNKFIYLILCITLSFGVWAQTANIPDANFLNFLKTNYANVIDANNQLIISEAEKETGSFFCNNEGINSLEGIQYFTKISKLYAYDNNLTYIPNLQSLTLLENLQLQRNALTSVPSLANLKLLRIVLLYDNQLTAVPDITGCDQLNQLIIFKNKITQIPPLNALKNLTKIDVGSNLLTSFPNVDSLINLEILITFNNQLKEIPNLQYATKLNRLNYGYNQITTFPDLSNNLLLAELSLDHNQLKSIPSLHSFTLLNNLELQNNYLTYAELTKIASHPNYSSNFILFNQNTLINRDTLLYVGNAITFECPFDINTAGTSYQWKKNGVNINNATQNKYTIPKLAITDSANYTCEIKNTNLPNTSINGVNYYLRIIHCPLTSNIYVKQMKPITCEENGVLEVELKNLQNDSVIFILINLYNNTATTNTNGHFEDLQHQSYQLQIKASPNCVVNYPSTIYVDKISDCKETYITPNGDGDRDTYEIEGTGTAFIYNKNGVLVNKLSLPQAWDGTDLSGKMVDVGLYFIRLNNEKKSLQISVLY